MPMQQPSSRSLAERQAKSRHCDQLREVDGAADDSSEVGTNSSAVEICLAEVPEGSLVVEECLAEAVEDSSVVEEGWSELMEDSAV